MEKPRKLKTEKGKKKINHIFYYFIVLFKNTFCTEIACRGKIVLWKGSFMPTTLHHFASKVY